MTRTRISTTVDAGRLERARALFDGPDSKLIDHALELLLRRMDIERERAALIAQPYDEDPDLSWHIPITDLPRYDGAVPEEVRRLAAERPAPYEAQDTP